MSATSDAILAIGPSVVALLTATDDFMRAASKTVGARLPS
jgi:hypothetical protein